MGNGNNGVGTKMRRQLKPQETIMKRALLILFLLTFAAYGQMTTIAVINTEDDGEPAIGHLELNHLTDRLREIARKTLPQRSHSVMTQQSIVAFLGSQDEMKRKCKDSESCLAKLGKEINADYIGQARIGRFSGDLTIKVELYGVKSGNLVGSFTGTAKDAHGLLSVLDNNAPNLFGQIPGATPVAKTSAITPAATASVIENPQPANTADGITVPGNSLSEKLSWLKSNVESHNTYVLNVNANENIAPHIFEFKDIINVTIILRGIGENRVLRLKSHGNMFKVKSNVTFVLDNNITLMGHNQNTGAVVIVEGGIFKMNAGATITGNLRDLKKDSGGGGVHINSGTFEMNGGVISGNTANYGGGVYVLEKGIFNMNGGTISGNTANYGGGVGVASGGTFSTRGTITGNIAHKNGGGVYITIKESSFSKGAGIITGYASDQNNGNVVKNEAGSVLENRGHAIFVHDKGTITNYSASKETTAGEKNNLSFSGCKYIRDCKYSGEWDK